MGRVKSYFKLAFLGNLMRDISMVIVLGGILIIFSYFLLPYENIGNNQKLPDNIVYFQTSNEIDRDLQEEYVKGYDAIIETTYPLKLVKTDAEGVQLDFPTNPYESNVKYVLEDIKYVGETDISVVENNQKKIRQGQYVSNPQILYNFNDHYLNRKDVSLVNDIYDVAQLDTGRYPERDNEILIGETTANYYLQKLNFDSFEELVGEKIPLSTVGCTEEKYCINDGYTVSGVYLPIEDLEAEPLIVSPPTEIKDEMYKTGIYGYFAEFPDKNEKLKFIGNTNYDIISSEDFHSISVVTVIKLILLIIVNFMLTLIWKRSMMIKYHSLDYYGRNMFEKLLIVVGPFIVVNVLFITILLVIK